MVFGENRTGSHFSLHKIPQHNPFFSTDVVFFFLGEGVLACVTAAYKINIADMSLRVNLGNRGRVLWRAVGRSIVTGGQRLQTFQMGSGFPVLTL